MKFISVLFIVTESLLVNQVFSMKIQIDQPWSETSWVSGQEANIVFEATPSEGEAGSKVSVDLMAGDPLDGLVVANVASDVSPSKSSITWKVPDYPSSSDYFVRVGTDNQYSFSHTFSIKGEGKTHLPPKPVVDPVTKLSDLNPESQSNNKTSDATKDSKNTQKDIVKDSKDSKKDTKDTKKDTKKDSEASTKDAKDSKSKDTEGTSKYEKYTPSHKAKAESNSSAAFSIPVSSSTCLLFTSVILATLIFPH